jgi:predicted DNA-binding WGR domain protein
MFWEIWTENTPLCVRLGNIATNGQTIFKEFPDAGADEQARDEEIGEKSRRGFTRVSNDD